MEKSRVRVNTSIASYLTKSSGCYIRYIKANHRFLGEDGVHLSGLGNDVFLNTLQRGIEKIVNNLGVNLTFPGVQSG
jgi:lysophospholipase L1-like esterase